LLQLLLTIPKCDVGTIHPMTIHRTTGNLSHLTHTLRLFMQQSLATGNFACFLHKQHYKYDDICTLLSSESVLVFYWFILSTPMICFDSILQRIYMISFFNILHNLSFKIILSSYNYRQDSYSYWLSTSKCAWRSTQITNFMHFL